MLFLREDYLNDAFLTFRDIFHFYLIAVSWAILTQIISLTESCRRVHSCSLQEIKLKLRQIMQTTVCYLVLGTAICNRPSRYFQWGKSCLQQLTYKESS